ncbi:MAG: hypothetical protein ACRCW1_10080 [Anaerotignaceae bacterium]
MTINDLAKEVGKTQSHLSQVIYGVRNDLSCKKKIEEVLCFKEGELI